MFHSLCDRSGISKMRVVYALLLLSVICEIKLSSASDVTCEVMVHQYRFDKTFTTSCELNKDVVISEPSTLSNSLNESVTEFHIQRNDKIEFLPQHLSVPFPNLRVIDAYGCSIKSVNKLSFQGLTKLEQISLQENKLETIEENSFEDLVNLRYLYLNDNKITELSSKVFANLENLDTIDLYGNQLTKLDADLFKNNNKIALLHVNDNKLQTLPAGIFDGLKLMRQLWFGNNEIVDVPPHIFDHCESLVDLDLSRNNIKTIDTSLLAKLTELREVSFSFNPIEFIDLATFDGNPNLFGFYFNRIATNDIRNIDRVDQMKQIKILSFYDGCINDTFHEGNLDKLKEIVKSKCIVKSDRHNKINSYV